MMASKFHKNGVLTGCVDCYCLACDSHLRCKDDACIHIEKPIHKKNLESTHYLDKYKEDHVRKVKKGYYCEFCNILLQTSAKVSLHTAEPKHHDNKGIQLLKRLGNSVISPNDVCINENAWNGFIDETCAICNAEFHNEHIHKTEQKHILNLIQKEVVFGEDKTVYRKIDETSFQCLTCNMIFPLSTITTHSKNEDHKTLYAKCREFQPPVTNLFYENDTKENNISKNQKFACDSTIPNLTKKCGNTKNQIPNTDKKKEVTDGNHTKTSDENQNLVNVTTTDNKRQPEKEKTDTENVTRKQISESEKEQDNFLTWVSDCMACTNEQKAKNDDNKTPDSKTDTEKKQLNVKSTDANATKSGLNKEGNDTSEASTTEVDRQIKKDVKKRVIVKKKKFVASPAVKNTTNAAKNLQTHSDKKSEKNIKKDNTETKTKDANIDDNKQIAAGVDQVCVPAQPVLRLNGPQEETAETQSNINLITGQQGSNNQNNENNLFENLSDYQKNGININFETGKAICMKCFESVGLDCKAIEDHIKDHKDKPNHAVPFTPVLNKNHSKTVLKEEKKATKNVNHNQNITNDCQKPNDDSKALVRYVPIAPYYVPDTSVNIPEVPMEEKPQATPQEDPKDPESYAKANKLTFNNGNKNAFCRLCSTRLPSSLRSMKEHVNGNAHKTKAARVANLKPIIPKKPMKVFVKVKCEITNRYSHDIVVNDRLCVTSLGYWMITENEVMKTFRCQACEVNLTEDEIKNHVKGFFHERAMDMVPVVWNLDTEFVREVRPGIFHCGFCNLVVGCWENVAPHLKCEDHEMNQLEASCRLEDHMPDVLEHRRQREREFMSILFNHFF